MFRKKILIDLDGVLNNYRKFDENVIPEIKHGAKEFIEKLFNLGVYDLFLFTTRNKILAVRWLIDNDLEKYFKDVTDIKMPAYLYIDDRSIKFNGDYNKTLDEITNFEVYWKNQL
jgi:hypothetical protein